MSPSASGFTLIEILVVMSLLSLLALGMGSALRTTAQTGERVDAKLLEADEIRVATTFLRSVLGRVHVQRQSSPTSVGQQPYFFEGNTENVTWIGIMPARHGVGGRAFFRLYLGRVEGKAGLVLQFLPWDSATVQPDWSQSEARILVEGAADLRLKYVNTTSNEPRWVDRWDSPDMLPDRLSISLGAGAGSWPDLVIPLRATPSGLSGAASGEPVFGGSSR
ncbi:MAG: prepilin-type N-terminal cleavage/methylation domain-containing protein [Gammaproteobacteria bacterium]|nr:prepilin-type N-terminal cleavage/methylation domain-containing protein [Gammaproteobacteria bacterium]